MSLAKFITNYLMAQAAQAVQNELLGDRNAPKDSAGSDAADKDSAGSSVACCESASIAEEPRPDPKPEPKEEEFELGFVFALPMEAAGIADRYKEQRTIKGDGLTFRKGLFAGYRTILVESGVGAAKACRAAELLLDTFRPKRLVSAGYGGALVKDLKRLAVCFPQRVVRESDGASIDLTEPVPRCESSSDPAPPAGRLTLLTSDQIVARSEQKRRLAQSTGAWIVDMETYAVAELCAKKQVPLLTTRIILDTAEEELPDDVQKILAGAEKSKARMAGLLLGSVFSRPSAVLDLFSLKQRALEATDRLAERIAKELN